jgi:ribose transport system permease protein
MNRIFGILVTVLVLYGALMLSNPNARSLANHKDLAQQMGFYGILTLGAGILIISGGIDLSIGSVVGLSAVCFALLLEKNFNPYLAAGLTLLLGPIIGLFHGLLVTKLRLQPFLVTLCGLFIYRGLARWATWTPLGSSRNVGIGDKSVGVLEFLATGNLFGVPMIFLVLLGLAAILTVFLHNSVYGRYLYAIGSNEQAARYAGIPTDRYKILAYMICSTLATLGGIQYMLELGTASPASAGNWYELYAITGAVLGGCSLRGGEGSVGGLLLGTAVLPLLRNLRLFAGIPDDLEFTVIGLALLLGTIVDELLKRRAARGA